MTVPDAVLLFAVRGAHARIHIEHDTSQRMTTMDDISATQIGLTATPKETEYVSNIDYFGDPVFTYSLRQGIGPTFDLLSALMGRSTPSI